MFKEENFPFHKLRRKLKKYKYLKSTVEMFQPRSMPSP